jgi:hypothetical protein
MGCSAIGWIESAFFQSLAMYYDCTPLITICSNRSDVVSNHFLDQGFSLSLVAIADVMDVLNGLKNMISSLL